MKTLADPAHLDFVALSAHQKYAPFGTGALVGSKDIFAAAVAAHETELTAYALEKLPAVLGIQIYGNTNPKEAPQRLGVIPLSLASVPHFVVAAILDQEFGIGVRSGCFCAHPYILHLLKLTPSQAHAVRNRMLAGEHPHLHRPRRISRAIPIGQVQW